MSEGLHIGFTGTKKGISGLQLVYAQDSIRELIAGEYVWYFHHGDCLGADAQMQRFAATYPDCITVCHPPTDESFRAFTVNKQTRKPKIYRARDYDIAYECQVLVSTPREMIHTRCRHGTCTTTRYASKLQRRLIVVQPNGKVFDSDGILGPKI